jgi:prepilin-type N-terminal cleavage/methylation domain-containing protein
MKVAGKTAGRKHGKPLAEGGFSLIELLMVVSIIGILVAIASASYVFVLTRSKETACKSNRRVLEGALNTYCAKEGFYPEKLTDLFPDYIENQKAFSCPLSGQPFEYSTNADRTEFTLTCPTCKD